MNQVSLNTLSEKIQAIDDLLNYYIDVKEAAEKGLEAPPMIKLNRNFRLYTAMSPERLQEEKRQMQEEKRQIQEFILMRGNFLRLLCFSMCNLTVFHQHQLVSNKYVFILHFLLFLP